MKKFFIASFLVVVSLVAYAHAIAGELYVRFFDVGHADAALVMCDGKAMLIDGGNKSDSRLIYTALKNEGISHLDIVVATHAHADHIGGLPAAYNSASVGLTLCPVNTSSEASFDDFEKYANKSGGITIPSVGDTFSLGDAIISIVGVNGGNSENDTSIVLRLQYGDVSFLFTGDAEHEAEQTIINSGLAIYSDVLKVGHHGSANSTSAAFLDRINPAYAVISVDDGEKYGTPAEETLQKLYSRGIVVYRTNLHGDITVKTDGKSITFATETVPRAKATVNHDSCDYVLNTNSKRIHTPACQSVGDMKEKNKEYYNGSIEYLFSIGYEPCRICNP